MALIPPTDMIQWSICLWVPFINRLSWVITHKVCTQNCNAVTAPIKSVVLLLGPDAITPPGDSTVSSRSRDNISDDVTPSPHRGATVVKLVENQVPASLADFIFHSVTNYSGRPTAQHPSPLSPFMWQPPPPPPPTILSIARSAKL
jgi:hypothetical protein